MIIPVKLNVKKVLVGMLLGVLILFFAAGFFIWNYVSTFSRTAGLRISELVTLVRSGINNKTLFENRDVTFLFLGLDKRDDEFEKTTLTDTMLLGSLNTATGKLTTIPLPRDIWIPDLSTKINALYFYGEKNPTSDGMAFTAAEVEKITGVKPEFTVVLNYLELPALIDSVGGVEIAIERSFEDARYPNPDYVATQQGAPYMTVAFQQGTETMNGARALSFVRSRESTDPIEGSDLGRSKRQMLVLSALVEKLKSRKVLENPQMLGNLYRFWHEKVETTLSDDQAIALALASRQNDIQIHSVAIPTSPTEDQKAILINPPVSKYGLWVWETRDRNWRELKEFVGQNL